MAIDNLQVARALRYILDQYSNRLLGVNDVVGATDLSRRELEKAFRKELQRTINEEIVRVRLDRVKDLLVTTTMKAVEISVATGFSRTNHFFRTFRKLLGLSPKVYRARLAADEQRAVRRAAQTRGTDTRTKRRPPTD